MPSGRRNRSSTRTRCCAASGSGPSSTTSSRIHRPRRDNPGVSWVETASPSFTARHESAHEQDAEEVLDALEAYRMRLRDLYPRLPENVTVILHDSWLQLALAQPYLPVARRLASPAARRYIAGWFGAAEVHVLAPECLRAVAGGPDSLEALMLTPQRVYTMLVAGHDNLLLPPPVRARTLRQMLRAPWLL